MIDSGSGWVSEARARADRATPGPWVHVEPSPEGHHVVMAASMVAGTGRVEMFPDAAQNAEFIAHARVDLVRALDVIDQIRALHANDAACCPDHGFCVECDRAWPCPTIQVIDAAAAGGPVEGDTP